MPPVTRRSGGAGAGGAGGSQQKTIDKYMVVPTVRKKASNSQKAGPSSSSGSQTHSQSKEKTGPPASPRKVLAEVFVDVRISDFPKNVSPGGPVDAMANYIIENPKLFGKKPQQRRAPPTEWEDELEPAFVSFTDEDEEEEEEDGSPNKKRRLFGGGTPLEAFIAEFCAYFEAKCKERVRTLADKDTTIQLLLDHFPWCRGLLISQLVDEFAGRYTLAAWVCLFVESRFAQPLRRYFAHVDDAQWTTLVSMMPAARKARRGDRVANQMGQPSAVAEFRQQLASYRQKYPTLFTTGGDGGVRLLLAVDKANSDDGEVVLEEYDEPDRRKEEKLLECEICFQSFPRRTAVCCNGSGVTMISSQDQDDDELVGKPTNSKRMKTVPKRDKPSAGTLVLEVEEHAFCVDCFVGQARAATAEMPLAQGGIGLPCMALGCTNPLLFSSYRALIPPSVRRLLNERILEENLGLAQLANLERCPKCAYAVCIDAPPNELRVFSCARCGHQHCRMCDRPWPGDDHFGKRCAELDAEQQVETRIRKVQNKMSEAVSRRCHRCAIVFIKEDGCNKMACRCGATQCYLCRTPDVDYNHYCRHARVPGNPRCPVKRCKKACLLWTPAGDGDAAALAAIRREARADGIPLPADEDELNFDED